MSGAQFTDEQSSVGAAAVNNKTITYNDVATKLLSDRLLLTALELHTELVESGREIKQLKDFFSNPGNFELQSTPLMPRSGSQATLDSLDLTRFSEDGERGTDERVAVLEFELRKAKETISALRANLTVALESENNTPDSGIQKQLNTDAIKPHEQRALNFLINEYLLMHGYKLTSITFADENENQDFEDWDDVGLNIAKPAELLTVYREGLRQTGHDSKNISCQTDFPQSEEFQNTIKQLNTELDNLKIQVHNLQVDNEQLTLKLAEKENQLAENALKLNLVNAAMENDISTNNSSSPDRFEMIDKSIYPDIKNRPSLSLEDDGSVKSLNEWTKVTSENLGGSGSKSSEHDSTSLKSDKNSDTKNIRELPVNFRKELYAECLVNVPTNAENQLLDELLKEEMSHETLIHTLSASLLKIIPNIILNKREEVIPLLISAVHLNPNSKERDKLLQQLFNLKKRPSEEERRMILAGILRIAKCQWENIVENEVLPQCWEQLTHKHVERRLLVAESCSALTPYVMSTIRNSLMLSMLQQMLEDKDENVRIMVIRALALVVAFCDDSNKYSQCEELTMITLDDVASVVHYSIRILFPVLAKWALDLKLLQSNLIKQLLHKFNALLKDIQTESPSNQQSESNERILQIVTVLNTLIPYILMSVTAASQIFSRIEDDMVIELKSDFVKTCSPLTNPTYFFECNYDVGMILYEFDNYMALDNYQSWPELDWFIDIVLPDLLNNVNLIDVTRNALLHSVIQLFSNVCIAFGKNFSKFRIKPIFQTHVQNLEQMLTSFNDYPPNLSIIPVYLISVLSYLDDLDDLLEMLKRFICALPLCGTPLDCLEVIVKGLCEKGLQELVVSGLWEGVVHQKSLVRSAAAGLFSSVIRYCGDNLLCTKVAPALVTLASDTDLMVRTATIPALGTIITDCSVQEVHDKAYMQLQSFLTDANAKDHAIMRSLVVTLAYILNACKPNFRDDVIIPQLSAMSAYTSQMSNQTRKIDMASALIDAFSTVVYSPLNINRNLMTTHIYPGIKYIESIVAENSALHLNRDTVSAMLREVESRIDISPQSSVERNINSLSQNVNQGVEDMRNRMSKIFNKPNITKPTNLPNIQGIFKKK